MSMSALTPTPTPSHPHKVAVGAVGLAQRAMEEALSYAMERKAFGKPIIEVRTPYRVPIPS